MLSRDFSRVSTNFFRAWLIWSDIWSESCSNVLIWFVKVVTVSRRCWLAHSKQTDKQQCEHLMNEGDCWQLWHWPEASTWKLHDFKRSTTVWFKGKSVNWLTVAQISLRHVFTGHEWVYFSFHSTCRQCKPEHSPDKYCCWLFSVNITYRSCDHTWAEHAVRCTVANMMDSWPRFLEDVEVSLLPLTLNSNNGSRRDVH